MSQQPPVIDTSNIILSKEERKIFESDVKRGLVTVDPDGTIKLHGFGDNHDITLQVDLNAGGLVTDFGLRPITKKALAFYREISTTLRPKGTEIGQPASSRIRR